ERVRERIAQPGEGNGLHGQLTAPQSCPAPLHHDEETRMTNGLTDAPVTGAPVAEPSRRPSRSRARRSSETRGAWLLISPYLVLLMIGGIIPVCYALVTALETPTTPLRPRSEFGSF